MDARFGGGGGGGGGGGAASGGGMLARPQSTTHQQQQLQHQQQQLQQHQTQQTQEPSSWSAYFPGVAYNPCDRRAVLLQELLSFFAPPGAGARLLGGVRLAQQQYVLPLDADGLIAASGSADLSVALEMQPLEALSCISAAVHEALFSRAYAPSVAAELLRGAAAAANGGGGEGNNNDAEEVRQLAHAAAEALCSASGVGYGGGGGGGGGPGRGNGGGGGGGAGAQQAAAFAAASASATAALAAKVAVRLHNYSASRIHVRQVRSSAIGRLVTVRGTVVRASHVRPLLVEASAVCSKCGEAVRVPLPDGRYAPPRACPTEGCRGRSFVPDAADRSACVDWQRVRLQEVVGAAAVAAGPAAAAGAGGDQAATTGRAPRSVDVELRGDLAGCCAVGDTVVVTGVVRVVSTGERAGGGKGGGGGGGGRGGGGGGGRGGGGGNGGGGKENANNANQDGDLLLVYLDAVSVTNSTRPDPHAQQHQQQQQEAAAAAAAGTHALVDSSAAAAGGADGTNGNGHNHPPATPAASQQQQQHEQQQQQLLQQAEAAAARAAVGVALSVRDLQFVLAFTEAAEAAGGNQLGMLAASLCPQIHGHELVKAGLVLALLGGVRKDAGAAGRVPVRGDAHVLLVGDPGLGKSHLLRSVAAAAPRGMYVCGNTATPAGLTVAVTRDPLTGDTAFEAGAVVLADRGLVCLDEFDKASHDQHQALLEAMEQQEVSVAKAGLIASLPARTAVIAAANPVGGHYDKGRTLCDNISLSPAMLSRFDLTFVLLDRPNAERDAALSEHVLAAMRGGGRGGRRRSRGGGGGRGEDESVGGFGGNGNGDEEMTEGDGFFAVRPSVVQRVRAATGKGERGAGQQQQPAATMATTTMMGVSSAPPQQDEEQQQRQQQRLLPPQLLRKYIAYARAHVFPVLSEAAARVIQDFYLQLRAEAHHSQHAAFGGGSGRGGGGRRCGGGGANQDAAPVTARQLESLVRLAEARARADLRTTVTREDAEDAVEIARGALLTTADAAAAAMALNGFGGICTGGGSFFYDGAGAGGGGPTMSAGRGRGGGAGGRAGDAERFVAGLQARSRARAAAGCDPTFEEAELQALVIELRVNAGSSVDRFLAQLNEAGDLLKSGPGRYRVRGGGGSSSFAAAGAAGPARSASVAPPPAQQRHAGGHGSSSQAVSFGGGGGGQSQFLGPRRGRRGEEEEEEDEEEDVAASRGGGGGGGFGGGGGGQAAPPPPSPPGSAWW